MEGWSLHKMQDIVGHGDMGEETAWCDGIARESNSTTPRDIQRGNKTKANDDARFMKRLSAPVNIPEGPKVYGKNQKRKKNWKIMVSSSEDEDHNNNNNADDDEEEDEGEVMLPPHEWLARKHVRNQISSFSVCEGLGRTLKGRDLNRVRNAILTKTGFLE